MADVKWIKLAVGLPDDRKIKQIRTLPDGDTLALLWVFLMCLAGETNDNGMVYFTKEIPYTEEMLSEQFKMDINTVRLGLNTFCKFGMIEIVEDIILLSSWEKWQATDSLDKMREDGRKRVARHRAKQKALASGECNADVTHCNVTGNADVTHCNAIEEEGEEEIEEDKEDNSLLSGAKKAPARKPAKKPYEKAVVNSSPVAITITLNDLSEYPIFEADVRSWSELYPAVNIMQELRKMKGWCDANPTRRKTKNGIKRFINSWLSKEQDNHHGPVEPRQAPQRGGYQNGNVFLDMLNERRGNGDV